MAAHRSIQEDSGTDYEPILPLGSGGMGTAWLCRAVGVGSFERLVVVKRLHPHIAEREEAILRFMDEASLTGSLHHANVVGTHHVGVDERGPFIVLEYIEGASLDHLVDRTTQGGDRVPVPIALRIMLDALSGLQAVHTARDHSGRRLNILHRDISLQNLLVGVDGLCRVADFGAAKSDIRKYSTDQRYLLGKLLYLPPEYLKREDVGPTLDIYSLGITLWQTLTGTELWEDDGEAQVVSYIIAGGVPKLSDHVPVPPALDSLVQKATHVDPTQRFQSAEHMAREIEALGRESGLVAVHSEVARWVKGLIDGELQERHRRIASVPKPTAAAAGMREAMTTAPPPAPTSKSRRGWVLAGAALGLVALAGAVVASIGDTSSPVQSSSLDSPDGQVAPTPGGTAAPSVVPVTAPAAATNTTPNASPNQPERLSPESADPKRRSSPESKATRQARQPRPSDRARSSPRPVSAPDTVTTKNPYR